MPHTPPLIVFDLDGTLVDSAPDLIACLNVIIGREGLAPLPLAEGRLYVGRGGKVMIRRGLAASGVDVSDVRLEQMFAAFLAYYDDHLADQTRFYPGVEAALDELAATGHDFAICTNKIEAPAKKLVRALGAMDRFKLIAGQDTFAVCKPNGAALKLTIERAGGDPRHAIMVGDTETDVATAKDAHVPVIAVDFGYCQVPIGSLAPDRVISHFSELPDAVAALSKQS